MTPRKINLFMIANLPSVYICGVRVKELNAKICKTGVRYKWINKNPFKSMFWAVQGMAAELSTGALVMQHIEASGKNVSMLLLNTKATFLKKAKGKIVFTCEEGDLIKDTLKQTINSGEGATCWMKSVGTNEMGEKVSEFYFEWTVKLRK
jgi:hypothetical protein